MAAIVFFPTDGTNWWCQKSSVSCTVLTCFRQNLRNRNKENLAKSIGVVQAKYPPKVKLENFYYSRVLELGELCVPWFVRVLGFYSNIKLTLISWWRRYFLVENIPINTCNFRDSFLIGLPSIVVGRGVQNISILRFLETTHAIKVTRGCHEGYTWL